IYRQLPDLWRRITRTRKIKCLSVWRFQRGKASVLCHTHRFDSSRPYFSDVVLPSAVRREITPPSIVRPTRYHILKKTTFCQSARLASFQIDHVDAGPS